jgi:hypothetical protein
MRRLDLQHFYARIAPVSTCRKIQCGGVVKDRKSRRGTPCRIGIRRRQAPRKRQCAAKSIAAPGIGPTLRIAVGMSRAVSDGIHLDGTGARDVIGVRPAVCQD